MKGEADRKTGMKAHTLAPRTLLDRALLLHNEASVKAMSVPVGEKKFSFVKSII